MSTTTYTRLSEYEREMITRTISGGNSLRELAETLKRSPSTIYREAKRGIVRNHYCSDCSHRIALKSLGSRKKGRYKLKAHTHLYKYVTEKLYQFWSPQQIASRLKEEYPQDATMHISHEAIYQYLYIQPSKELRRLLRHGHMYRYKRGRPKKDVTRGSIPDMTLITERPEEVISRLIPGHWEGDLIKGKFNKSAIGTLVERSTRYVLLVPLTSFDAKNVRKSFAKAFSTLPKSLTRSLTYDQGKEMSEHAQFTLDTDIKVYFAHPRSPWERGSNENTNGLIRQFFPKGTDFSSVTRKQLMETQDLLNDRQRKVLGFRKPDEVLSILLR